MGERAILTPQFVDDAAPPSTGERWIADTRQRGFGLRIIRSNAGLPKKSYCVRIEHDGVARRSTFNATDAEHRYRQLHWWELQTSRLRDPTLGDLLSYAREWAYDEVAHLTGKPTLAEENEAQLKRAKNRILALTFEKASELILQGMSIQGLSQAYQDRLAKAFVSTVPKEIAVKTVYSVTLEDVREILARETLRPGTLRLLRPLLGQILDIPSRFGVRGLTNSYHFRYLQLDEWQCKRSDQLAGWSEDQFDAFLQNLEADTKKWQQALCLRLYFELYAPLSAVMSARWDQLRIIHRRGNEFIGTRPGPILQWW